jgi:Zn-dependent oligopeptidase
MFIDPSKLTLIYKPELAGEDKKLFEETLRDYKRAGLSLDEKERNEVEKLRKELSALSTDFDSNITKAEATLEYTAEELKGVPDSFWKRME